MTTFFRRITLFLCLSIGLSLPAMGAGGLLWSRGRPADGRLGDGVPMGMPIPIAGTVTKAAGGGYHTVFVKNDGTLWAVGNNDYLQLGDGTYESHSLPIQVATNVTAVTAGYYFTAYLRSDGAVWAFGSNTDGQFGNGKTAATATLTQVATSATAIAAGDYHLVYIKPDRSLWGAGRNTNGQLGDGTTVSRSVAVKIADGVIAAAAGDTFTLYITTDRSLWVVGTASFAANGGTLARKVASGVASVVACGGHMLYLATDGVLWGAGENTHGNLGDGTSINRTSPLQIVTNVRACATGRAHSAFIKTDNTLWTMGTNAAGQLADPSIGDTATPVRVATGVSTAATGFETTLYVGTDGVLMSAGSNYCGELGNGKTWDRDTALLVASDVVKVAATPGAAHTMFIKSDGTLWAMGLNTYGQLGDGTTARRTAPVSVATNVKDVAVGTKHTLFVKNDGTLWGVGFNGSGQLGDGTTNTRFLPIQIARDVSLIAAGDSHSVYLGQSGTLWAMGSRVDTITTTNTVSLSPIRVYIGSVAKIAAGANHTVVLDEDGAVWTFGNNAYGQLGNGRLGSPFTELPGVIAQNVQSIAAGGYRTLFVKRDGSLWGAGDNQWGMLGMQNVLERSPVQIATQATSAAVGKYHNVYTRTDGSLWCNGYVTDGGFGGDPESYYFDVVPAGTGIPVASGATSLAAGDEVTYYITPSGVGTPPTITTAPVATDVRLGERVTLTVAVAGSSPLGYRWRKDGVDLPGERSSTLVIPYAQANNAGSYDVVVTNQAGSVTSSKAAVSIGIATIVNRPAATVQADVGATTVLKVTATADEPLSYQWQKDGTNIANATSSTLTINNAQPSNSGLYTLVITAPSGSMTVSSRLVVVGSRIVNLSVLTDAGTGTETLIVGFVLGGDSVVGNGSVLVRCAGPSLNQFGVGNVLADPTIDVRNSSASIGANDNWNGSTALSDAFARLGAFPFSGSTAKDSAVIVNPSSGGYSALVGGGTGTALVELYDASPADISAAPHLINVSARAQVGASASGLTVGIVIKGSGPKTVLFRAIGPTLAAFSVPGALADPQLEVWTNSGSLVATNDDWGGSPTLVQTFQRLNTFGLDAASKDAVVLLDLDPGSYSARVTTKNGASGVCLIEAYEVK